MSKQASAPGLLFLKTGVGTKAFGQVLGTRQESEVPVMGSEILTCPGKLRCRGSFFQKCLCGQIFSHRPWAQDGKVRSRPRESEVLTIRFGPPSVLFGFASGRLRFCSRLLRVGFGFVRVRLVSPSVLFGFASGRLRLCSGWLRVGFRTDTTH